MAASATCPLCDRKFSTTTAMNEHVRNCSYPKDKRKK